MKSKRNIILVLFLILITIVWCSVLNAQEQKTLILKSYIVPEKLAPEICRTMNELLFYSVPKIGQAKLTPDGQCLISAPESFHTGVKDFIEQLKKNNPAPSSPVEIHYWIVAGKKADTPAKLDEFREIKPALETIQKKEGSMAFKLLDHVSATSMTYATLQGAYVHIDQNLTVFSDGSLIIQPKIQLMNSGGVINTQIEIKGGELVMLGRLSHEIGIPVFEPAKEGVQHRETVNVYYIVSAVVNNKVTSK